VPREPKRPPSHQQDRGGRGRGRDGGRDGGRGRGRFVMPTGQAFFTGGTSSAAASAGSFLYLIEIVTISTLVSE
jgi:hypothetical protein